MTPSEHVLAAIKEDLDAALFDIDQKHQIHGHECLCGFASARSRSRTEHITGLVRSAMAEYLD